MSFNNNYENMYNLTFGAVQNTYKNIYTNIVEIDINFDFMLYTNLIQYEHYFFQWCIYLLKYSLYYIYIFILFEFVSKMLGNIYIYSSVTRGYIRKYNHSQQEIETLYFEIEMKNQKIDDLNTENDKLYNNYKSLHEYFFHTKTETKDDFNEDTNEDTNEDFNDDFNEDINDDFNEDTNEIPMDKNFENMIHNIYKRTAAKKATKRIKELVEQKLV